MYVRPQNSRYSHSIQPPINYSGSTFRAEVNEEPPAELREIPDKPEKEEEATAASLLSKDKNSSGLFSLFGNKIGSEELLILAVILLLADSEGNDELLLFLILLFFIK